MQLGLNLINEEKILGLVRDFEEEKKNAEGADDIPRPELLEDTEEEPAGFSEEKEERQEIELTAEIDIGMLELLIESIIEKKNKKVSAENKDEDNKSKNNKTAKDDTLKGIVKEIDRRFGAKHKKLQKQRTGVKYIDPELMKGSYGLNLNELFSYLRSKSATDVYKDFYSTGSKDQIYNFVDEPLSYAKLQKIQLMTKVARYAGYMGDTEYCGHEMLDADTKEKWHLVRNITHVFILTMLRYDVALQ